MFGTEKYRRWLRHPGFNGGGSGGGGSTTQTVQNYSPEEIARRTAVQDEAARIYNATSGNVSAYPGAAPVAPSQETLAAENYLRALVPGQIQNVASIQNATNFGLGNVLYANSNPYLQSAIGAAVRPITQSYTDPNGVMAQIRQGAVEAGGVGGSREGIAQGVAAGRYAQAVGDTASKMANENYQQGLDTFEKTLMFAPSAMQAGNVPAQTLANVGASTEGRAADQAAYQEQQALWNMNAPWMPLQNYANMVYGSGSQGSTSTGTMSGSSGSRLLSGLSGGLTGYSLASALGVAGGPVGWGMMGLGALAGLM